MRICAIGDSFVHGTGDPEGLGWIGRLVRPLTRSDPEVTLYNLGIRRNTSADIRRRWLAEAEARLPASIPGGLIFSFGVNDCCPADSSPGPRVEPDAAVANARAILSRARDVAPTLVVGPPPIADAGVNARIAVLDPRLAAVAETGGVPYLSVFDHLVGSDVWMKEVAAWDGAHPGAAGYALLAELVEAWSAWQAWTKRPAT